MPGWMVNLSVSICVNTVCRRCMKARVRDVEHQDEYSMGLVGSLKMFFAMASVASAQCARNTDGQHLVVDVEGSSPRPPRCGTIFVATV